MCIRIIARNGHQRALNQVIKCVFAYFICGTALTCPLDDSHRGNTQECRLMEKWLREISHFFVAPRREFAPAVHARPRTPFSINTSTSVYEVRESNNCAWTFETQFSCSLAGSHAYKIWANNKQTKRSVCWHQTVN